MEMKKVFFMTMLVAVVFVANIGTSTANSVVNNRKMMDSDILLSVYSSLGQCWGKGCAPWSPCQSGCTCVGAAGVLGACVGPLDGPGNKIISTTDNSVANNHKLLDTAILLNVDSSLGQCIGKFCAPWSPCQSGCVCVGPVGFGACVGPSVGMRN